YSTQGFQILAFPCNDFGNQEPGPLSEIQEFCSMTYDVNFEFFDKVHAKGTKTAPYDILTKFEPSGDVEWNFEKFLISKNSDVVARYKSNIEPDSSNLISALEEELKR
ncbi:MAG TPA: glutathione peroxidase, partial [Prochlorococcaceae cyanobacterium AMR_MDS_5431]|nr:glutathione peroxidase [Prochlorococcaceae cyanobacterium AMR_MDS_5431]